jgi:hypothetical protein
MADAATGEFFIVLQVTLHTEFVCSFFQGRQPFLSSSLAVVAGLAFGNRLPSNPIHFLAVWPLGVMAAVAIQPLMGVVGQVGWFCHLFRVNRRLDDHLFWPLSRAGQYRQDAKAGATEGEDGTLDCMRSHGCSPEWGMKTQSERAAMMVWVFEAPSVNRNASQSDVFVQRSTIAQWFIYIFKNITSQQKTTREGYVAFIG